MLAPSFVRHASACPYAREGTTLAWVRPLRLARGVEERRGFLAAGWPVPEVEERKPLTLYELWRDTPLSNFTSP
jgi:hypothetical protein